MRATSGPGWSSSARPTRPSSAFCPPPSRCSSAPPATPGTRTARRAARAAARRRRWPPAWCRWRTPATAAARSASRPSCCGLFGLKPTRGRNPAGPGRRRRAGRPGRRARRHALGARQRRPARRDRGPDVGRPYWAPPRPPVPGEVGADPGQLRIAFTDHAVRRARCTPTASPRSRTRRALRRPRPRGRGGGPHAVNGEQLARARS